MTSWEDETTLADPERPTTPHGERSAVLQLSPGAVLAGRYRIAGRLGGGGMGVVYRADDLRLGIPLALKVVGGDPAAAAELHRRLLDEVRLAREVTHPNVCRVYDLGEADGVVFLTMEHVDGEDLASLLRRIGRLPAEKALDIARQLCAGLAAAHARGVLHRDLKPGNVMLDGRGQVRIVDFGLAVRHGGGRGELAGTPEYMAPEQLVRGETSVRSDLWALGAVLYELFTGRRAFRATTLAELRQLHAEGPPPPPSRWVPGIDPDVEGAVLRCLEADPAARPASAAQVAAALPGGDRVAALVAAGETPPPELVAASGGAGTLRPAVAMTLLAVGLLALPLAILFGERASALSRVRELKQPAALADRAAELVATFRLPPATDTAHGFVLDRGGRVHLRDAATYPEAASPLRYWYRSAPAPLLPEPAAVWQSRVAGAVAEGLIGLRVLPGDPPLRAGEALVVTSPAGRLVALRVHRGGAGAAAADADLANRGAPFAPLLAMAGFGAADLREVVATRGEAGGDLPAVPFDRLHAWEVTGPRERGTPLRVTGASLGGAPVALDVVPPWAGVRPAGAETLGTELLYPLLFFTVVGASAWAARRNLRLARADREGARRGAIAFAGLMLAACLLVADHVAHSYEAEIVTQSAAKALFFAVAFWLTYLALEPAVRRRWPGMLVGTSRLLQGRGRDPLVAREALLGAATAVVFYAASGLLLWQGQPGVVPLPFSPAALEGLRGALLLPIEAALFEMIAAPIAIFLFVQVQRVVRHPALAAVVMTVALSSVGWGATLRYAVFLIFYVVFFTLLVRAGALAAVSFAWIYVLFDASPLTTAPGSAAAPATTVVALTAAAVLAWGFWHARERPIRWQA
jgi:hypothetical protein